MATTSNYSLVLLGRFPGKDRAVAQTLARDFGRDDAWGLQVVGAAPIVLLDAMSPEQAQAAYGALSEVEKAGCRFEIQPGVNAALAKLSWPSPARIKGRTLSELGAAAAAAPTSPAPAAGAVGSSATLLVPCPYTGQNLKVTLTISVERMGGVAAAAAAPAVSAAVSIGLGGQVQRLTPAGNPVQYQPIKTPVVTPAVSSSAPVAARTTPGAASTPARAPAMIPLPRPTPAPRPSAAVGPATPLTPSASAPKPATPMRPAPAAPVPGNDEPVIIGLDSLDDLVAEPAAAPSASPAPLPDVPVLYNAGPALPASPAAPAATPMPDSLMSAPMDLSAFEAKLSGSGIMRAVNPPASPESAAEIGAESAADDQPGGGDDGSLCTVTMGKNPSPKVHQLVAELQGIEVAEAAKICQKPIVSLAKDVSVAQANEIRQQFAALRVSVRIARRT